MKVSSKLFCILTILTLFISCGSSSGGGGTPTTTATYTGAMNEGDYAEIDVSGDEVSYDIEGHYFPDGTTGTLDASAISVGSETTLFFDLEGSGSILGTGLIGDNLGFMELSGVSTNTIYVLGLNNSVTPTTTNIIGTYGTVTTTGDIQTWQLASDDTDGNYFVVLDVGGGPLDRGCWQINGATHVIEAWSSADCSTTETTYDYYISIRPNSGGLNALVADYSDGTGFASGVKQAELEVDADETFFMLCSDGGNQYKVTVTAVAGHDPNWTFYQSNVTEWTNMGTGTIELNLDCDGNAINGSSCGRLTAGTESGLDIQIFADFEEGYFMAYNNAQDDYCAGETK